MITDRPKYVTGNIFLELGLGNLSEEKKMALLDQMNDLVHKRTMLKVIETLSDEQKQHIMNQKGIGEVAVMQALQEVVPNLGALVLEEVEQVKNEVKATMLTTE